MLTNMYCINEPIMVIQGHLKRLICGQEEMQASFPCMLILSCNLPTVLLGLSVFPPPIWAYFCSLSQMGRGKALGENWQTQDGSIKYPFLFPDFLLPFKSCPLANTRETGLLCLLQNILFCPERWQNRSPGLLSFRPEKHKTPKCI